MNILYKIIRQLFETKHFIGKERLKTFLMNMYFRLFDSIDKKIITAEDGRKFRADLGDGMYNDLYFTGNYEKGETLYFKNELNNGDTLIDIGANFGWYTTLFSTLAGDSGEVHAFEPVPWIYDELNANIALNHLPKNIKTNQIALGDKIDNVVINTFSGLSHGHSSISNLGRSDYKTSSAAMVKLDDYIKEHMAGRHIAFIKMDVEGAELMVLDGAIEFLTKARKIKILFEINFETASAFKYRPVDIIKKLEGFGFEHFSKIGSDGNLIKLDANAGIEHGDNIVCIKK